MYRLHCCGTSPVAGLPVSIACAPCERAPRWRAVLLSKNQRARWRECAPADQSWFFDTATGIYGVRWHIAPKCARSRRLGVRMALGASRADVRIRPTHRVAAQGLWLTGIGLAGADSRPLPAPNLGLTRSIEGVPAVAYGIRRRRSRHRRFRRHAFGSNVVACMLLSRNIERCAGTP